MRNAVLLTAALVLGASLLVVLGTTATPLARECGAGMPERACAAAVDAVLARGLPELHPLILAAHVEPGPAAETGDLGLRATVGFDLLGVPDRTLVELYYDQGGHWGGVSERSDTAIAAWALAPLLAVVAVGGVILAVAWRGRTSD